MVKTLNITVLVLAQLLFAGCAIIQYTPLGGAVGFVTAPSVKLEEPFIIAKSEYLLGHGFYAFPLVRKMADETLVIGYASGDTGKYDPIRVDENGTPLGFAHSLSPAISVDDGETWNIRAPKGLPTTNDWVADSIYRKLNRSYQPDPLAVTICRHDGSRLAFSDNVLAIPERSFPDLRSSWEGIGVKMTSVDGNSWSGPTDVLYSIPAMQRSVQRGEALRLHGDGLELSDGTLLLAGYQNTMTPYRFEATSGHASILLASVDGGNTFTTRSVIASGRDVRARVVPDIEGPCEPCMVQLESGELLCLMRTWSTVAGLRRGQTGPMLLARSNDGGQTWKRSTFPYTGVRPRLLVLSDGSLVCTFGRPGNTLVTSGDGGRTWGRAYTISPPDLPTTGYTDIREISPGRLLLVYDLWDYDVENKRVARPGDGVNVVMARFVNIRTKDEK